MGETFTEPFSRGFLSLPLLLNIPLRDRIFFLETEFVRDRLRYVDRRPLGFVERGSESEEQRRRKKGGNIVPVEVSTRRLLFGRSLVESRVC